jgi:aryl carrier-like protein
VAAPAARAQLSGHWIVIAAAESWAWCEPVVTALAGHGARITRLATASELPRADPGVRGVLLVPPVEDATVIDTLPRELERAGIEAPSWIVTRSAVTATAADGAADLGQARLWDLGLAAEHPYRLADLPETAGPEVAARLASALAGGATAFAVRASGLHARRLTAPASSGRERMPAAATAWLSGGTPEERAAVLRWLARDGVKHVILSGENRQDTTELTQMFTTVRFVPGIPADLSFVVPEYPLAVVHLADGGTTQAEAIDELTRELDVSSFLVFTPWVETAAGQRAEALVRRRRARGGSAALVSWSALSAWDEGPQACAQTPESALWAVRPLLAAGEPVVCFTSTGREEDEPASGTRPMGEADACESVTAEGDLRERLSAATPDERESLLVALLCDQLASVLGHGDAGTDVVDAEVDLMDLGLTSFAALELTRQFQEMTGLELTAGALFDNPTPAALARHLTHID